jgi:hypothetical protein
MPSWYRTNGPGELGVLDDNGVSVSLVIPGTAAHGQQPVPQPPATGFPLPHTGVALVSLLLLALVLLAAGAGIVRRTAGHRAPRRAT